ncbi:hypothetical protein [Spiroplasma monobiae]|uniref:Lipoprotein n=1 Tax=Spiroplasma monobiae MQ-1 TaxID=1336748 RepID=A0A2K9LUA0_SPISQ|nr:hypothetical protein [Spiroplasma monobiae]AUM62600.1 hypothetical protein SMONO_v1c03510 [Spiroplasma monobiae MQ-1]
MKKLIKLLSVTLITASTTGSVVACGPTIIKKEKLRNVDTNLLLWSTNSFYWTTIQDNAAYTREDVIREFNENYNRDNKNIIFPDGILSVEALTGENNTILLKSNVYSNYNKVENIEIYFVENENIRDISDRIENNIQSILNKEYRYNYLEDAKLSLKKGLLDSKAYFKDEESFVKILENNDWNGRGPLKIDIINSKWTLDLTILQPLLDTAAGYTFGSKSSLSGDINIVESNTIFKSIFDIKIDDYYKTIGNTAGTNWLFQFVYKINGKEIFNRGELMVVMTLYEFYIRSLQEYVSIKGEELTSINDRNMIFNFSYKTMQQLFSDPITGGQKFNANINGVAFEIEASPYLVDNKSKNTNLNILEDYNFKKTYKVDFDNNKQFDVYSFVKRDVSDNNAYEYSEFRHNK